MLTLEDAEFYLKPYLFDKGDGGSPAANDGGVSGAESNSALSNDEEEDEEDDDGGSGDSDFSADA